MREKYATEVSFKGPFDFIGYGTRWEIPNFSEAPFVTK